MEQPGSAQGCVDRAWPAPRPRLRLPHLPVHRRDAGLQRQATGDDSSAEETSAEPATCAGGLIDVAPLEVEEDEEAAPRAEGRRPAPAVQETRREASGLAEQGSFAAGNVKIAP